MQVKYTPWETRNLGVSSSIEFYVEQDELWNDISGTILNHNEDYQVLHIQSGNTEVLMNASQRGFIPIELNIQLCKELDAVELPRIYKRFENSISCSIASDSETELILNTIQTGDLFCTDKVARDPRFGVALAGQRYAFWTKDVIESGATLLCMKYKEKVVAFDVLLDTGNGVAEAFLGGTLPDYMTSGMGFVPIYMITKYAYEHGYKRITTGVSSNNPSILKLHEMFGYSVKGMSYCLVKHN